MIASFELSQRSSDGVVDEIVDAFAQVGRPFSGQSVKLRRHPEDKFPVIGLLRIDAPLFAFRKVMIDGFFEVLFDFLHIPEHTHPV